MGKKHQKTLEDIYNIPVLSNILWDDIIALFKNKGAKISQGSGSRVRVKLNDVMAVFHRPHPQKETDKGAVSSVKRLLENAGVKP